VESSERTTIDATIPIAVRSEDSTHPTHLVVVFGTSREVGELAGHTHCFSEDAEAVPRRFPHSTVIIKRLTGKRTALIAVPASFRTNSTTDI